MKMKKSDVDYFVGAMEALHYAEADDDAVEKAIRALDYDGRSFLRAARIYKNAQEKTGLGQFDFHLELLKRAGFEEGK